MECSEPGAIRNEELIAYLLGEEVRADVVQHLASCQCCATELEAYRRMEYKLIGKLYRWNCPSSQKLGEYQLELLSSEQAAAITSHLRTCMLCAAEIVALSAFLTDDPMLVESAPMTRKGASLQSSSHNHQSPVQDARQVVKHLCDSAEAGLRRIVATFLSSSHMAYQMRGDASLWPRRYIAEDVSISLHIEQSAGRKASLQLVGLVSQKGVLLEALQGTPVLLSSSENAVYTQQVDDLGNFVFSSIVPTIYTLEVQFPERVVVIDQLSVTTQG